MSIPILTYEQLVVLTLTIPLLFYVMAWAILRGIEWNKRGRPKQ